MAQKRALRLVHLVFLGSGLALGCGGAPFATDNSSAIDDRESGAGDPTPARDPDPSGLDAAPLPDVGVPALSDGGASHGDGEAARVSESGLPGADVGIVDASRAASDAGLDGAEAKVDAGECFTTCCDEVPGGPTGFMCVPYPCPTPCPKGSP